MIIKPLTQKWVISFTMPDGTKNGGFCNDYKALPELIEDILIKWNGTNIIIKDGSIYPETITNLDNKGTAVNYEL